MRIIGIDPGTALLGFGVIDAPDEPVLVDFGVVETTPDLAMEQRLRGLYEAMQELLESYHPDVMAIEQLFFARNVTTAITVGQARGVILLAAAEAGLEIHEFTPLEVKLAVTGQGRATKEQVGYMVKMLLSLDDVPRPDDVADALAVALTCAQTLATKRRWGDLLT